MNIRPLLFRALVQDNLVRTSSSYKHSVDQFFSCHQQNWSKWFGRWTFKGASLNISASCLCWRFLSIKLTVDQLKSRRFRYRPTFVKGQNFGPVIRKLFRSSRTIIYPINPRMLRGRTTKTFILTFQSILSLFLKEQILLFQLRRFFPKTVNVVHFSFFEVKLWRKYVKSKLRLL